MFIQTMQKKISLLPNWRENNYEGYANYITQMASLNKTLSSLMTSSNLDVVSLDVVVDVTVKEKKTEVIEPSESTDSNFWLDVALEKYE